MYASLFFSESTLEEEREKIKKYFRAIPPRSEIFPGRLGTAQGSHFSAKRIF